MAPAYIFVTFLALAAGPALAAANPLEDAAHEATVACARLEGVESLEECEGNIAPSPYRPEAKRALQRLYAVRTAFIQVCDTGHTLRQCQEQAELSIMAGIFRDFRWIVERTDQPRSDSPIR